MPIREFTDSTGVNWRVWPTLPGQKGAHPEALRGGWLTFECANVKKRIVPIPDGWDELSVAELEKLCGSAQEFRPWYLRRSKSGPDDQIDPQDNS